jgi:hypothetical protein
MKLKTDLGRAGDWGYINTEFVLNFVRVTQLFMIVVATVVWVYWNILHGAKTWVWNRSWPFGQVSHNSTMFFKCSP